MSYRLHERFQKGFGSDQVEMKAARVVREIIPLPERSGYPKGRFD